MTHKDEICELKLTTIEDIEDFIPRIPAEDNEDTINGWGMTSEQGLRESFSESEECYSLFWDNQVVAIIGALPNGNIWLMRSSELEKASFRFARHGHKLLAEWLQKYGHLTGFLNSRYRKFVRWLQWEGFKLTDLGRGYWQVDLSVEDFLGMGGA